MGIVYVITNPAMPGFVKIGKTDRTMQERLRDLDQTNIPVPFECVAAWEFPDAGKVEAALHRAFADRRERRNREFFTVSPDQPIAILEAFGAQDVTPQDDTVGEAADEDRASLEKARSRRENFRFRMVGIEPGATLVSVWDAAVTCTVVDDRRVEFEGEETSLSASALKVLHRTGKRWRAVSGPDSWCYGSAGRTLRQLANEGAGPEGV